MKMGSVTIMVEAVKIELILLEVTFVSGTVVIYPAAKTGDFYYFNDVNFYRANTALTEYQIHKIDIWFNYTQITSIVEHVYDMEALSAPPEEETPPEEEPV